MSCQREWAGGQLSGHGCESAAMRGPARLETAIAAASAFANDWEHR
jgi:hypothetical protein